LEELTPTTFYSKNAPINSFALSKAT